MDLKKYIEDSLAPLSPVLKQAGKSIEVSTCEPPKIVFQLTGFCGGCECSSSYKEGLRDLVLGNCPEITDVQFVDG